MSDRTGPLELLLIEDNPGDARLIERYLRSPETALLPERIETTHETSLAAGLGTLDDGSFDILLLDLGLPESRGLETLEEVLAHADGIPVIVLTGLRNRATAVEAIQEGAGDYLNKDSLNAETLTRSIRYAIERRERRRTLRRRERELEAKNERLERFASVVSHDLRNPLNVAFGYLDLARERDDPAGALDRAEDALARMDQLVDDLLLLARQGEATGDTAAVDLAATAADAWANVAAADATLSIEAEGTVEADGPRLKQVFENLFRNAVEHGSAASRTPDAADDGPADAADRGDDPVSITVGTVPGGFYVEDDGVGIPGGAKPDVFEYGYTTHDDGTGFGLAIVAGIVESHGWELSVDDGDRGGVRFEIRTEE